MEGKDSQIYQHTPCLIDTEDGSKTLYIKEFDEPYHSRKGALQESMHVFIQQGLVYKGRRHLNILEVGFGTGLNALLSLQYAVLNNFEISYTGYELNPLPTSLITGLNYNDHPPLDVYKNEFLQMHLCEWGIEKKLHDYFTIKKVHAPIQTLDVLSKYDLVYFDAFAPEKQPEMWCEDVFETIYNSMQKGGVLVTYCAKGQVRRNMQKAKFRVERLAGPPGKREMLRAIKD